MKKVLLGTLLVFSVIVGFGGCGSSGSAGAGGANAKATRSAVVEENLRFQMETDIDLGLILRALYSAHRVYANSMVLKYFTAIMNYRLVYHVDMSQKEFARQTIDGDIVHIIFNEDFKNFNEAERHTLVANATAALAYMRTPKKQAPVQKFFKYIEQYDNYDLSNIKKTRWFQSKKVQITNEVVDLIN